MGRRKRLWILLLSVFLIASSQPARARGGEDSAAYPKQLEDCVRFALIHHPAIRQSLTDEEITEREISSKLADWYPQINFNFSILHSPQLPVTIVGGTAVPEGLDNTSNGQFSVTQTIFNRDALFASSTAEDVRIRVRQRTASQKIAVVVGVSKAYYAVLTTAKQVDLLSEDIVRLEQSLKDAYSQYHAGVVDKIDYQRASIALNNAKAEKRQYEELLKTRLAFLKEEMGYPSDSTLSVEYDSTRLERDASLDTAQTLSYEKRVEYQSLVTQKRLQEANVSYAEWGFLPSLTAFGNYDLNYQSVELRRLYGQSYPNSNVGLELSFPIFLGGKRIQEIREAELEVERADLDLVALRNSIDAEFAAAIASYKSNLNNYRVLKQNLELARDVYKTIQLQYKAGTKSYLEVIIAETDLRTAQANEANAFYEVLSSKLDVERALGAIQPNE
ncbi:MAG TPA: TolC family protein [Bacteroidota bacterium]|nr:TolC family protein [Bacteroidota bacterium]